ncbi:TPA: hypothetical protein ENS27_10020, partial [bacterium]|nr:hypothetical protein [bacterium]
IDYSQDYPNLNSVSLAEISYKEVKSGEIEFRGNKVPTTPLSSYSKAREIAETLKEWIKKGEFLLTEPAQLLPSVDSGMSASALKERP